MLCKVSIRASRAVSWRIKFYMSISKCPITIIRGDNFKSISFLYDIYIYIYMYVCMYVCMYICICMYVCMYVWMYVCMCMYVCMYIYIKIDIRFSISFPRSIMSNPTCYYFQVLKFHNKPAGSLTPHRTVLFLPHFHSS